MAAFYKNINLCKCLIRHQKFAFHLTSRNVRNFTAVNRISFIIDRDRRIHTQHPFLLSLAHGNKLEVPLDEKDAFVVAIDEAFSNIDSYLRRCGRVWKHNVDSVFAMIKERGEASSTLPKNALYLLRCCRLMYHEKPSERVKLARDIWNSLQLLGCKFDVSHYNALLRVYLENEHKFSPTEMLSIMEKNNVEPDKTTYLYLMENYCNDGNLNGASEILEFIKEQGLPVNERIFNCLIKGYVKINDFSGANNMLEAMRSSNIQPSADSYTALACGYAMVGDIDGIKSLVLEKNNENRFLNISANHYLEIISALAVAGHEKLIDEILGYVKNPATFQQDFIKAALELIHKDLDDVAFKIIKFSVHSEVENQGTNIFVKQLIKNEKPVEKIIKYCGEIHAAGLNNLIFLNAARASIDCYKFDYAFALFEEMLKKGIPVRTFDFLPIFTYFKEVKSVEGVSSTLAKMSELGVLADYVTYVDYILPAFENLSTEEIFAKIQDSGQSALAAIDPLFEYLCKTGKIDQAYDLIKNYDVSFNKNFKFKELLALHTAFMRNFNYLKVIKYILNNVGKGTVSKRDAEDLRGKFIFEIISTNPTIFDRLLKQYGPQGFHFSDRSIHTAEKLLREKAPALMGHLRKLENSDNMYTERNISVEDEENHLERLEKNGLLRASHLFRLLNHHIRNGNVDRVRELKSKADEKSIVLPPHLYSRIIKMFCAACNLEMIEMLLRELKTIHPGFKVDLQICMEYAVLLIKFLKLEEALEVLKNSLEKSPFIEDKNDLMKTVKRFVYAVIETKNLDFSKAVYDELNSISNSLVSKEILVELLIRTHLNRGDLDAALDEYRNCVVNHSLTPCINLLLKRCITSDDETNLQRIVDVTSHIPGNVAVFELVAALIETNHLKEAKKALENFGNKMAAPYVHSQFEDLCKRFYIQGKAKELETFVFMITEFPNINEDKIMYYLIKLHAERNDYKKCLDLYNILKDTLCVKPSEKTYEILVDVLAKNKQPIPSEPESSSESDSAVEISMTVVNDEKEKLLDYVEQNDASMVLDMLRKSNKGFVRCLTFNEVSRIIDLMLEKKCLSDLSQITTVMSYIIEKETVILKPLLEAYSEAGNVDKINSIASFIPDFTLKKIHFNTYWAKAYIQSERHEELLSELEEHCDKTNRLFSVFAFEELLKIDSFTERLTKLAYRYFEKSSELPVAIIWAHHFVNENFDKADSLLKLYPSCPEKVDARILKAIRQEENVSMGWKFVEILKGLNNMCVKAKHKERAYGTLLDLLVLKGMYEEAVELIKEAEQLGVLLQNEYQSTFVTLKIALERENKPVPFNINNEDPAMNSSSVGIVNSK